MKYVQITVDGVLYTLREKPNGEWVVTNKAPYIAGEYPIEVIVTTEAGQTVTVNVDDPELLHALLLIVTEGTTVSGERMRNYYPEAIRRILDFQAIIASEGFEVDFLKSDIELIVNDAYLSTMSEERVARWEQALGIASSSDESLQDRRDTVIARIRGQGKLNTKLINTIVNAFTGGTAESYVKDSVLYVEITPPPENKQYKFDNVVQELSKKVPAHLGISVTRNYATWEEVADNFASWDSIKQLSSWQELLVYTAPQ